MKIVITGARGSSGTHLQHALRKNNDCIVEVLDHEHTDSYRNLRGATHVVHLAGVNRGSNRELLSGNITFTEQLLSHCHDFVPKAGIIFASSSQVYSTDSFYGQMKLSVESLLEKYSKCYSVPITILRFSNIYGPLCSPFYNSIIATFIYQIMHGKMLVINGDGNQKRDFLYITDAIGAIQRSMSYNPEKAFQRLDICSGKRTSINQLLKSLIICSPKPVRYQYAQESVRQIDSPLKKPILAKNLMGWKPTTSLKKGLANIFTEEYAVTYKKITHTL